MSSLATGWLQALDPRSKLALCFVGLAWVLSVQAVELAFILALAVLLLLSSHIAPSRVRAIGLSLTPLIVVVLITWPLFYSRGDEVWFAWAPVRITRDGVLSGITAALRILALVYVLALLVATTDQARLIRALVKLGLPYAWGLTISMSLRYIPTLYALYRTVVEAQAARAWAVPTGHFIRRAQGYLPVLIAVLIGAIRLSDQTAMALTARGLDASLPRVPYRETTFRAMDWLIVLLALVGLLALLLRLR